MLLIVLLVSAWLGFNVWQYRKETGAARQLDQIEGEAIIKWKNPAWLPWIGAETRTVFGRVSKISIMDESLTSGEFHSLPLADFTSLETVYLECPNVSDDAIMEASLLLPTVEFEYVLFEEPLEDTPETNPRPLYGRAGRAAVSRQSGHP